MTNTNRRGHATATDELPETGEGLHGERLSLLPNTSEDFPNPGRPVDLGREGYVVTETQYGLETQLPETVSAKETWRAKHEGQWGSR